MTGCFRCRLDYNLYYVIGDKSYCRQCHQDVLEILDYWATGRLDPYLTSLNSNLTFRESNRKGRYSAQARVRSVNAIIAVLKKNGDFMTTNQIASESGVSLNTVRICLRGLAEDVEVTGEIHVRGRRRLYRWIGGE